MVAGAGAVPRVGAELHAARFMMIGTNNRSTIDGMIEGLRFLKRLGPQAVYDRPHNLFVARFHEPGTLDDADLVAGSGTGKPNGIMTASTGSVTTGGSLIDPTYEKFIDVQHTVADEYRQMGSAAWLMNDRTIAVVRKLRDGAGGTVDDEEVAGRREADDVLATLATQSRERGDYVLTTKLVSLGLNYLKASGAIDLCQPILDRLAESCGELVRLGVVDVDHITWVSLSQGARAGLRYDPDHEPLVYLQGRFRRVHVDA